MSDGLVIGMAVGWFVTMIELWRIRRDVAALRLRLAPDWENIPEPPGLPDLTESECQYLGLRMGEAGVLPGEWAAVWEREYRHARVEKAKRTTRAVSAAAVPAPAHGGDT